MIRLGKVSVLSHPKKHTLEHAYTHTHHKKKKVWLAGWRALSLFSPLTFPQAPYRVSFLMSTQCIKT